MRGRPHLALPPHDLDEVPERKVHVHEVQSPGGLNFAIGHDFADD
jgi:hypothetical protein